MRKTPGAGQRRGEARLCRLLRRAAGRGAPRGLAVLVAPALTVPATAETPFWMFRPIEQNHVDCSGPQPPAWCAEWRRMVEQNRVLPPVDTEHPEFGMPSGNPYPAPPGRRPPPPSPLPEEEWRETVRRLTAHDYRREDLRRVQTMADFGATDALEILGWMYAEGVMVDKSAEKAYEYYGRALLAGAAHVRPNLDILWPQLSRSAQTRLRQMFDSTPP